MNHSKTKTTIRCQSPICKVTDGVRGREFTIPEGATGIATKWCPLCVGISTQITFFAGQTADMIRNVYKTYIDTNLPKQVKIILEQYTKELLKNMNQEL